jgi:hypothetical protein
MHQARVVGVWIDWIVPVGLDPMLGMGRFCPWDEDLHVGVLVHVVPSPGGERGRTRGRLPRRSRARGSV